MSTSALGGSNQTSTGEALILQWCEIERKSLAKLDGGKMSIPVTTLCNLFRSEGNVLLSFHHVELVAELVSFSTS